MEVVVSRATQYDRKLIENLLQFYIYDFTEFTSASILENGSYNTMPDLDSYWNNLNGNHPYLIKVNDEIAGFILTKEKEETRKYNYLAHFFILRKFRRLGIGSKAAEHVLKIFKGEWELYQLENNIPAQKFWDRIIEEISDGEVKVRFENGRRYQNFIM
ncbi:GNAT family N-acetyltransferase [Paenibacillus profundus]|uniref:GNAT family N-acetyltransferase n=1 Tax=Paenibacillus profundus TaxID=1173085 RepID=A0ABS8YKW0_9BACL|nr:GNAT family N-acetyltransferase [Paenibacillus profundus]MCE5172503.1 GNAT family N-acetyltransferase [Paenibacillus profundus]